MLKALLRRKPKPAAPIDTATLPDGQRVYAIGDIHGRRDLLDQLLDKIVMDDRMRGPADTHIVFLGDLMDRGPDSAGVIDRAIELSETLGDNVHFLMGNHEEVYLAAADGEAPNPMNPEPWVAGTALVVWLVAFAILAIKVWPVITKGLDERNDKILGEIKAAEDARAQAKQALAEYEKSLADAREEANRMIADARAEAQRQAEEMKASNERELAEKMARAKADIEAAKKAAVADIHGRASELAATVAGRILQREINPEDQARLVEESIRELDAAGV